jgi:excisionase family DNA binding protein
VKRPGNFRVTFMNHNPQPTAALPRLLTIKLVAAALALSTKTVRRRIESGELKAIHIGRSIRVARDELDRFIIKNTKK